MWKPDGITMRRMTADPSGAFRCSCGHHGDNKKVSLSDAFQTRLRVLFQGLRGAHAPTSRIAFIVFLEPQDSQHSHEIVAKYIETHLGAHVG